MSYPDEPLFDVLSGDDQPYQGFGDCITGAHLEARYRELVDESTSRVKDTFEREIRGERGVVALESIVRQMWEEGWEPGKNDLALFSRDFGSLLADAVRQELGGEIVGRSLSEFLHLSIWWPEQGIEVFPFHKMVKRLSEREGEGLPHFIRGLKGLVRSGGIPK